MKKITLLVMVISIISYSAIADDAPDSEKTIDFFGYYENQGYIRYNKNDDKLLLLDYNKLRLDLKAAISEKVTFNADIIFMTYHGSTSIDYLEYLPSTITGSIPPETAEMLKTELENTYFINDAYVTVYLEGFSVRIGKQQIPWGTGYTWNPTDTFNSKNQLDPTYENEGVNAITVDISWGADGSLTGIAATLAKTENPSFAAKLKKNIAGFDLSVSYQYLSEINLNPETLSSVEQQRNIIGFDFTGEIFTLGFWGEGTINFPGNDSFLKDNYAEFLLGMDYTFQNELYLMAEYLHRTQGAESSSEYNLADFMKVLYGETTNIGADYIACGISYPLTDYFKIQMYSIMNLNDESWILIPWLIWDAEENLELNFSLNLFFGKNGTEYGEYPNGGLIRCRVYF